MANFKKKKKSYCPIPVSRRAGGPSTPAWARPEQGPHAGPGTALQRCAVSGWACPIDRPAHVPLLNRILFLSIKGKLFQCLIPIVESFLYLICTPIARDTQLYMKVFLKTKNAKRYTRQITVLPLQLQLYIKKFWLFVLLEILWCKRSSVRFSAVDVLCWRECLHACYCTQRAQCRRCWFLGWKQIQITSFIFFLNWVWFDLLGCLDLMLRLGFWSDCGMSY